MKKPLALLALLLLGACVPKDAPQVTPLEPAQLGLGAAAAPRVQGEWWKAFGDPQADRLAAQVVAGNPTLQAALARIRGARAELQSANAADQPQIELQGSEQRELLSKDFIIPPPYAGTWRWMGNVQANLTWSLDFWGKQAALIAKAQDQAQAAALDAQAARLALSGAFAQAYIDLYLAYVSADIADQAVAEREEILRLTQNRFNAGLENPQSLEQAKSALSASKSYRLRLSAQRDLDVHAIAALAGQGAADYGAITRPTPKLDVALPMPASLPADLLSRRPDILAARARIDAAMQGRAAAKADFYPNIDITAFAGFQAIGLSNLASGDAFTTGLGPAVHLPIFDAGKLRADYRGATAKLDEAVADYNGAVVNAIKQSADAMTQVSSLAQQRAELENSLASAEKSFAFAQTRYKTGLSDQVTLLGAENNVLLLRQQYAALMTQQVGQRILLMLSVGGGFNPTDITVAYKDKTP